jgi:anti-sigma B factor antagonist/stage II sporulation protein AA (anti-sigma F factor antagonist)
VVNQLKIDVREGLDATTVTLEGDLDIASSARFEEAVAALGETALVVDLRGLSFIDSSGLRSLLAANERCQSTGRRFVLIKGPDRVQRLLTLTQVADRLELVDEPNQIDGSP